MIGKMNIIIILTIMLIIAYIVFMVNFEDPIITKRIEESCKNIHFPNKDNYDVCVLELRCEMNCNMDFNNNRCPKECATYYNIN